MRERERERKEREIRINFKIDGLNFTRLKTSC